MTIQFCVITYVIASELARQLVLVGLTTRCPRSPERRKFSVVSFFSLFVLCHSRHYVISVLTFYFGIKLFKPHGPLLFLSKHPRRYRRGLTGASSPSQEKGKKFPSSMIHSSYSTIFTVLSDICVNTRQTTRDCGFKFIFSYRQFIKCQLPIIKAGVNVKAALTSLNTAFLPVSLSHFQRR